jgi:hypothetical protein
VGCGDGDAIDAAVSKEARSSYHEHKRSLSMALLLQEYTRPTPSLACPFCVFNRQMRKQHGRSPSSSAQHIGTALV